LGAAKAFLWYLSERIKIEVAATVSRLSQRYRVIKTLGSGTTDEEIGFLYQRARQELEKIRSNVLPLNIQKEFLAVQSV
jgi:hypothetical protein